MTSLPDIAVSAAYAAGSPAAADKVSAAQVDSDHRAIAGWINDQLLPTLARVIRDDDTLIDGIVRHRNLHQEILASLAGLTFLEACAVATTAPIVLTGLQAIDGYTTLAGDRVLVTAQANSVANGIYVAAVGAWTRASDADDTLVDTDAVTVTNGTSYGGTWWRVSADATIGSDDVAFLRIFTNRLPGSRIEAGTLPLTSLSAQAARTLVANDTAGSAVPTAVGIDALTILATGSTTRRSLGARLAETVNVKDHGALGDGLTNDTAAIEAAIAALPATGGTVYFPNGVYCITDDIDVSKAGVFLRGDNAVDESHRTEIRYTGALDATLAMIRCTASAHGFSLENLYLNANDLAGYCLYLTGDATPLLTRGGWYRSICFQGYRSKGWVIGDHTDVLNPAQFQVINAYDLKFTGGANAAAADGIHVNAQNLEWLNIYGIYVDPDSTNSRHHRNHIRQISGGVNVNGFLSCRAGTTALTSDFGIYSNDQLIVHGWRSEDRRLINGAAGTASGPIHVIGLDQRAPTNVAGDSVINVNWLSRPVHIQAAIDGSITIGATNLRLCTMEVYFKKAGGAFVYSGPQNQRGTFLDIETGHEARMGSAPALDLLYQDGTRRYAIVDGSVFEIRTTMAQITANQNDYTLAAGKVFRLSSDAARTITGFAGTGAGRSVRLVNVGAFAITIGHLNGGSVAANQVISVTGTDLVLPPAGVAELWWDVTDNKWRGWIQQDRISGSATYDPASLADGAGATTTVTVTGAALGDFAEASFSLDLQGILLTAWVSAANTVSVRFQNETGGVIDLASGTLRARIRKA